MHRRAPLAASLLAAALAAGEPAAPLAEVRIADGAALIAGWAKTPIGRTWEDPVCAPLRARADAALRQLAAVGADPRAVLAALSAMQATLDGIEAAPDGAAPTVRGSIQADLGAFAEPAWALLAAGAGPDAAIDLPGATAALRGPAPPEAPGIRPIVARFGTTLVAALDAAACAPRQVAPAEHALSARLALRRVIDLLPEVLPADVAAHPAIAALRQGAEAVRGDVRWTVDLVPEGVLERIQSDIADDAAVPVDQHVLGKLPAGTLIAAAAGIDGVALWRRHRAEWLADLAPLTGKPADAPAEEVEAAVDAALRKFGVEATLAEMIGGLTGTSFVAVTPAAPFPGFSLGLPRSPGTDAIFRSLLKLYGQFGIGGVSEPLVPPAPGAALAIPLPPGVPVGITLICDERSWVLTSDPALAGGWLGGQPGGYLGSPAAKLALQRAKALGGEGPVLIGTSDTPAVLRTAIGFLGLALAGVAADDLPPAERSAALAAIDRLAANASPGYVVSCQGSQGNDTEIRGLIGTMAIPAIIAAVAIPNLIEGRIAANEDAAQSSLTGIHEAQTAFAAAVHVDQDGDGAGEFGFLDELTGDRPLATPAGAVLPGDHADGSIALLDARFDAGGPADGYRFAIFLPDGAGGALGEPAAAGVRAQAAAAADAQERRWVAYAWPDRPGDTGRRSFAITEAGIIHVGPAGPAEVPAWNALFGGPGKGWADPPAWAAAAAPIEAEAAEEVRIEPMDPPAVQVEPVVP